MNMLLLCHSLALRMRVTPGDTVVTSAGTYPTFSYFALGAGSPNPQLSTLNPTL